MSWFSSWFDSPYYHELYAHRDDTEACAFIDTLLEHLAPVKGARMLDLACGKGRHSRFLAAKGFDVTGLDLAEHSILAARAYENDHLHFFTQDMRRPYAVNYFDYVFSFFTSFGYFQTEGEHLATLQNVATNLHPNGVFVMDFMNAARVVRTLEPNGEKMLHGVHYAWKKTVEEGRIIKRITITDGGAVHHYHEEVRAFTYPDLERLFIAAGLRITAVYGNYALDPFDEATSDRLILESRKA